MIFVYRFETTIDEKPFSHENKVAKAFLFTSYKPKRK